MDTNMQMIFKRYEIKFLLNWQQKEKLLEVMEDYMVPDRYGKTTIRNLYMDTDDFRLIRASIEKPVYKEKLRIRSYAVPEEDDNVFVELKKKYRSVVYKRRLSMHWCQARESVCKNISIPDDTQIAREINYFLDFYKNLGPKVFLAYHREAYYARDNSDFRVTFDEDILCRSRELSLEAPVYGQSLLPIGQILMEIKCGQGIPLWLARFLSENHIYKTSFSKYGTAYMQMICPKLFAPAKNVVSGDDAITIWRKFFRRHGTVR